LRVLLFQPPSPPHLNVTRDWQGGFGVATHVHRSGYGHENRFNVLPSSVFLYTLGVLEHAGVEVRYLDGQVEQLDLPDVINRVGQWEPDLIVAAVCLPSLERDLHLLEAVRRAFPGMMIATAGPVSRVLWREILARSGAVDVAIAGDPEVVLHPLVQQPEFGDDGPHPVPGVATRWNLRYDREPAPNRLSDFNSVPHIAWHLLPMPEYYSTELGRPRPYATIMSSRGCEYSCGYYCPYPVGLGRTVLFRDPRTVGEELEIAYREYGREIVLFRDQIFTHDRDHALAVCNEMLTRGLRLRWFCETRFDRVDAELLRVMKAAGCFAIHYGLETGSQKLLSTFAKPGARLERAVETVRMTREAGLRTHLHVLLGLPDESEEDIRQTGRTLRLLRPDTVNVSWLTPYPGTRFWDVASREGLFLVDSRDFSSFTGCDIVLRTRRLGRHELLRAHRRLVLACAKWFALAFARRVTARCLALLCRRQQAGGRKTRSHGH